MDQTYGNNETTSIWVVCKLKYYYTSVLYYIILAYIILYYIMSYYLIIHTCCFYFAKACQQPASFHFTLLINVYVCRNKYIDCY